MDRMNRIGASTRGAYAAYSVMHSASGAARQNRQTNTPIKDKQDAGQDAGAYWCP